MSQAKSSLSVWRWLLLAAVIAGGATGYYLLYHTSADTPVAYATVSSGTIENIVTATGRLQPREYVDVGAQVSGQLVEIHVNVGDQVEEGQLLAEIDSTVYLANVEGTRAQLRNLQAQMIDKRAQLELADIQFRRQKRLVETRMTSEESLQIAEATQRSAAAQVQALTAQIEQTASSLRAEEARLNYSQIYAPMSGTVVEVVARKGQTLNATQQTPTILQIADLSVMTVQAQVSEADVNRLKKGMDAYFTTLGDQNRRWSGQLRRIEPTPEVENNVVLYNALFDVENDQGALFPQMTAQVFFIIDRAEEVRVLPVGALNNRPSMPSPGSRQGDRRAEVMLVTATGESQRREVTTGLSNRVQIEIVEGLELGDRVEMPGAVMAATNRPRPAEGPMRMPR
ncbi:efflux RND transporter periplasmic adaptor subunit [Nitrincola sp.]|uniref:efflux RND transporter periplasmic adaptor subunit n=1 Tax=Nitrincola sp. TaxID=1926584 RepID=UPI003A917D90